MNEYSRNSDYNLNFNYARYESRIRAIMREVRCCFGLSMVDAWNWCSLAMIFRMLVTFALGLFLFFFFNLSSYSQIP